MGKINLLSRDISELIAAGEVIERPASIVKELLENAIDAHATIISVDISHGGISKIAVTDNGCGMEKSDLEVAFLRHATSKIVNADDLDLIKTLGFRGEALASIAAVSRIVMTSKTADMQFGASITLEGGEQTDVSDAGCPQGTNIVIKDLFYNVPARLKFLKKDTSEGTAIASIMDKIALSHPEISFKLISENKIKLNTPGNGDMLSAIRAVFGGEFADTLVMVKSTTQNITVEGFLANPQSAKATRSMQHFFVNSRYVRSKTCVAAIEEGCKKAIMVGKYPACVLNVILPFNEVDVNVHPAKIEVRFVNEKAVFQAVYFAVKSTLMTNNPLTPETSKAFVSIPAQKYRENIVASTQVSYKTQAPVINPVQTVLPVQSAPSQTVFPAYEEERTYAQIDMPTNYAKDLPLVKISQPEKETPKIKEAEIQTNFKQSIKDIPAQTLQPKMLFELFKTYLLFEFDGKLMLMDKHAAHERILYEQLKESVSLKDRQLLLSPMIITFSAEEFSSLISNSQTLENMGFYAEEFGNHSLIVRECPMAFAQFSKEEISDILQDIAKKLLENKREITSDAFENLLHSMACRGAIKAHDKSDISELCSLLNTICENDELRNCPHGRPIVVSITQKEIEKKFGRI